MRIAIVTSSYPLAEIDGAAAAGLFVRDFAHELAKNDHEIHVITQDKGEGCSYSPEGVTVHCFKWPGKARPLSKLNPRNPLDAYAAFRYLRSGRKALFDLHDQSPIDHVLGMWAVPGGFIANRLMKFRQVPYSVWCLGSDIWTYGKIPVLNQLVVGVLHNAKRRYADGLRLREDAHRLAFCDIEFMPSSRAISREGVEPVGMDRASPRFQFVGRYDMVKGVDVLLQAMRMYLDRGHTGSLRMLGGGAMDDEVRAMARDLDLLEAVHIGGYADGSEVVASILGCDALVIPSRNESIPLVFSDALRLGKPVIASDVGDMGDLLREVPAGLIVPPEDPEALADAFEEFADAPPGRFTSEVEALGRRFEIESTARRFLRDIGAGV
ncbi:MAG: hypothetical protein Phyf2KO_24770 [Phycisphaerales bacterium]